MAPPGTGAPRARNGVGHNGRVTQRRSLPVPEGLDGMRLDAALSRLFGLSRRTAAELVESGAASLDGRVRSKGDRVLAGTTLEVDLPEPDTSALPPPQVEIGRAHV